MSVTDQLTEDVPGTSKGFQVRLRAFYASADNLPLKQFFSHTCPLDTLTSEDHSKSPLSQHGQGSYRLFEPVFQS